MQKIIRLFVFLSLLSPVVLVASTSHVLLSPEEMAIRKKARERQYPGGLDEEPLQVQAQLPQPTRKMGPVQGPVQSESAE